jgi:aspartate aminotransferase
MSIDVASYFPKDGKAALVQAMPAHMRSIKGSHILQIADEVRALKRQGRSVADFTVGDFAPGEFPIPESLRVHIGQALEAGETSYPPAPGTPELRGAIARFYARELGLEYPTESVIVASGARPVLYGTWRLFVEPGDRTLSFVPAWNAGYYADLCKAEHVFVPTTAETNFHPTVEQVADNLKDVQLVNLTSPSNPTGTMIDRDALAGIAQAIVAENRRRTTQRPVMLIYDQVYWMLRAPGMVHHNPVSLVPEVAPYVLQVDAISKSFSATGLRLGWTVMPAYLAPRMSMLIGHIGAWAPRPVQTATAWFLDHPEEIAAFHEVMLAGVFARLNRLYDGLVAMKRRGLPVDAVRPQGGIYLSFRADLIGRGFSTNEEIRRRLLEEAGVAIVQFQAFDLADDTGWFRMSIGAIGLDAIDGALERMESTLAKWVGRK